MGETNDRGMEIKSLSEIVTGRWRERENTKDAKIQKHRTEGKVGENQEVTERPRWHCAQI